MLIFALGIIVGLLINPVTKRVPERLTALHRGIVKDKVTFDEPTNMEDIKRAKTIDSLLKHE